MSKKRDIDEEIYRDQNETETRGVQILDISISTYKQ